MKMLFAIALTIAAIGYPALGHAATLSVNAGATTSATSKAAGTSVDVSASTSLSSKSTFSDVMASVGSANMASVDFSQVGTKTVVHIVKLSKLKGYSAGATAGTSAVITANRKALDAKVAANTRLVAKLKAAGFTSDQVVAESSTKSSVTLFVDDKA